MIIASNYKEETKSLPRMKLTAFVVVFVAIIGSSSSKHVSCNHCNDLYNTFKGAVKLTNASVAELEKIGGAICSAAPKPVVQACDFVLKDVSKIREAIVSGISSTDFCTDAGFCPKVGGDALVLPEKDDDKHVSCKLCNDLYNTFKGVVKLTNASVAELEKIGGAICSAAPKPVVQACDFVLADVTKIRVAIVDGIDSEKFCKMAGLCSSRVVQKSNLGGGLNYMNK